MGQPKGGIQNFLVTSIQFRRLLNDLRTSLRR